MTARQAVPLALLFLLAAGCSKSEGSKPQPPAPDAQVVQPVVVVQAAPGKPPIDLTAIEGRVDEAAATAEPAARKEALAKVAGEVVDDLLAAYAAPEAPADARTKVLTLLVRIGPALADAAKVGAVFTAVVGPNLAGEGPVENAGDVRLAAAELLAGLAPKLEPAQLAEAAPKTLALAKTARDAWGCAPRIQRATAAVQERLVRAALATLGTALARGSAAAVVQQGLPLLAESLRESPLRQDVSVYRAAADAVATGAAGLDAAAVDTLAPALVETLYVDGLGYSEALAAKPEPATPGPWARRALVLVARTGEAQREAIVKALLGALAVDRTDDLGDVAGAADAAPNERIALRTLACGNTLGATCAESESALKQFRDGRLPPERAACNAGLAPGADGYDAGFPLGRIWETATALLAEVLPPAVGGAAPEGPASTALAVHLLAGQLQATDRWATRVVDAKRLHGALVELYPDLMTGAPAATAQSAAPSAALRPIYETLAGLRGPDGTFRGGEARGAAKALVASLRAPETSAADRAACRELAGAVFDDLRQELLELADEANGGRAVTVRLWHTVGAARALALLGVRGRDDETLRAVLRTIEFLARNRTGFPIAQDKEFPPPLLWPYRASDGGRPVLPGLIGALGSWQRPTPEVLNVLLNLMALPELAGGNVDAVLSAQRYAKLVDDAPGLRALAARAFVEAFRPDEALPDAGAYLERWKFFAGELPAFLGLEQATADGPTFQLYPPPVWSAEPLAAAPETETSWLAAPPDRSAAWGFATLRDELAACALGPAAPPPPAEKTSWEGLTDEDKTTYCKKWVEPWATQYASETAELDIAQRPIPDRWCWEQMKGAHERAFEKCVQEERASGRGRRGSRGGGACRAVRAEDETYLYCVDLRFGPAYVERNEPTAWGCYDRFPWLRDREPLGPVCEHPAARVLAAYLYVKLRDEAGAAAADGVRLEALRNIATLPQLLAAFRDLGADVPPAAAVDRLGALVEALAGVQVEVPVFVRPPAGAVSSKTTARRPEGVTLPDFVAMPWWARPEWVTRQPRPLAGLKEALLVACRGAGNESVKACPPDGGRLSEAMLLRAENGEPGPLLAEAVALGTQLVAGDLVGVEHDVAALLDLQRCWPAAGPDVSCLSAAVFGLPTEDAETDLSLRSRALFLLGALAASGDEAAAAPLCKAAMEPALDPRLREVVQRVIWRARPPCHVDAWAAMLDPEPLTPAVP